MAEEQAYEPNSLMKATQQRVVVDSDGESDAEDEIIAMHKADQLRDTGFSVYSDPKFLYLIGRFCVQANVYIDLAIQCLRDYLVIMGYYKNFLGQSTYEQIRQKVIIQLAQALLNFGQLVEAEKLLNSVARKVKEDFDEALKAIDQFQNVTSGKYKGKWSHFVARETFFFFDEVNNNLAAAKQNQTSSVRSDWVTEWLTGWLNHMMNDRLIEWTICF